VIKILIFPLCVGEPAMFQRTFTRPVDADDYEAFWRALGSCHVRRVKP
jgi:hypothetical protein